MFYKIQAHCSSCLMYNCCIISKTIFATKLFLMWATCSCGRKSLSCQHSMLLGHWKSKCKLSSTPTSHNSQYYWQLIPRLCNLSRVGTQLQQRHQMKFLIVDDALIRQISCHCLWTLRYELSIKSSMQNRYAFLTEYMWFFSNLQIRLSSPIEMNSGVFKENWAISGVKILWTILSLGINIKQMSYCHVL